MRSSGLPYSARMILSALAGLTMWASKPALQRVRRDRSPGRSRSSRSGAARWSVELAPERARDLVAVHLGQADVDQRDVGLLGADQRARPSAPSSTDGDLVALHAQQIGDELAQVGGVVDTRPRAAAASCGAVFGARPARRSRASRVGEREADLERRALARAVARARAPCRRAARRAASTRPRPRPRPPAPSGVTRSCTNMSKIRRQQRRPGCRVPLSVTRTNALPPSHAPRDRRCVPPGVGVLDRVRQQIRDHLDQAHRIAVDHRRIVGAGARSRGVLARVGRAVRMSPTASSTTSSSASGSRRSSSLPVWNRATSSRSSTSRPMWWTWRWMMRAHARAAPACRARAPSARPRSAAAGAGCAARGRGSRGTRPCGDRSRPSAPSGARAPRPRSARAASCSSRSWARACARAQLLGLVRAARACAPGAG